MFTKKNGTNYSDFIIVDNSGDAVVESGSTEKIALSLAKDTLTEQFDNDNNETQVAVYMLVAVFEVDDTEPPMPPIDRIY